jgi:hypothetical protein
VIFDGPNDQRFILMGQGSVAVRAGGCPAGVRVDFGECEPATVGADLSKTETGPERVVLIFANVESIDVVMLALRIARERLVEKNSKTAAASEPPATEDDTTP